MKFLQYDWCLLILIVEILLAFFEKCRESLFSEDYPPSWVMKNAELVVMSTQQYVGDMHLVGKKWSCPVC